MTEFEFRPGGKITRIQRTLSEPRKLLKQVGALAVAASQEAFEVQKYGDTEWAPRSDVNVFGIISDFHKGATAPPERRFETRPALMDTGALASRISMRVLGSKAVEVGSSLHYASVQNFGGAVQSERITEAVRQRLNSWLKTQPRAMKARLGWILNKKFKGKRIKGEVPARPFVGVTKQLRDDVKLVLQVSIREA